MTAKGDLIAVPRALGNLPKNLIFASVGDIDTELAHMIARSGVQVTLVFLSCPLTGADPGESSALLAALKAEGIGVVGSIFYDFPSEDAALAKLSRCPRVAIWAGQSDGKSPASVPENSAQSRLRGRPTSP